MGQAITITMESLWTSRPIYSAIAFMVWLSVTQKLCFTICRLIGSPAGLLIFIGNRFSPAALYLTLRF